MIASAHSSWCACGLQAGLVTGTHESMRANADKLQSKYCLGLAVGEKAFTSIMGMIRLCGGRFC